MGEDETSHSLQELIAYHTEKIEKTLAAGTIRNFGITENYINRFLTKKRKTSDIYLKELNYKFICDFEIFLSCYYPKGHPKAMSHNTVMKHIQRLRKMVTIAYHLEWLEKDPFLRWKPTFEKKEREFLTTNELSNLETYEFPIKRLEQSKGSFSFQLLYRDFLYRCYGFDTRSYYIRHQTETNGYIPTAKKRKRR